MVNHVEGQVLLDGKAVEPKFGEFPQVNNEQTLSTEDGRVEVLLTPGAFLRLAEGSSFKMLSNRLTDTALEVLSGSAMIEVDELLKDNAITLHFKGATISLVKQGLYRFDTDFSRLRVYDGEANVMLGEHNLSAKKGKQVVVGDALVASSFDSKVTDPFYRWASRRSEYISMANVSSARTASANGLVSGAGSSYGTWALNPWFGLYTFLPGSGYGYSPFGWGYYSPYTVGYAYVPYVYGGGGTSTAQSLGRVTPSTYNGNVASSALAPARATPASDFGSQGIAAPVGGGPGIAAAGSGGAAVAASRGGGGASAGGGGASVGGGGGARGR
jgi:hypothetical protein